jgi:hypothetical protein
MIIHQPEMVKHNDQTIVFSKIEMRHPPVNFPEFLWYKVPDRYAQYLSLQSDAFLIPGLLAGMHFQEDIEVRGTISPKLAYHLDEYQSLLHFRLLKAISPVKIKYHQLKPLQVKPKAIGTTFSGGVDSFFTLWKHLPRNQPDPEYQITHALFILGFDIVNEDKGRYQSLYSRYHDALKQVNIELITLETNITSLVILRMDFTLLFGPVLIGAVHVLGGLFHRFFIPGSIDYHQLQTWPCASDPTSDPLLSTEILDIIHFGATHKRVDKIKEICDWDLPQKHLRVCSCTHDESLNCSQCEKCVRTLIPLYALGKMKDFSTFKTPFASNLDGLRWARKYNPSSPFVKEIIPFVRKLKPKLVPWLLLASRIGCLRYLFMKLIPGFVRNWLQRFGYFIDPMLQDHAFDNLEISHFIKSARTD